MPGHWIGLRQGARTHGVVLAGQVEKLDWRAGNAERLGRVPDELIAAATARVLAILDPE